MAPILDRPLIVLAEDSTALRDLLTFALERVGYGVIPVATGAALVTTVRRLLADRVPLRLIVTDVRMPSLSGLDAVRALRTEGHATPLIFMTAYRDAWSRAQAAELGALLLDKPISLVALRRAVSTTLAA
jgi:two-component system response regulator FixJ